MSFFCVLNRIFDCFHVETRLFYRCSCVWHDRLFYRNIPGLPHVEFRRLLSRLRPGNVLSHPPRQPTLLLFPHKPALALRLRIALRRSGCPTLRNNKAVLSLDVVGYCMAGFYKLFRNILCSIAAVFLLPPQQLCTLCGAPHACARRVLDSVAAALVLSLLLCGVPQLKPQAFGIAS